MKLLQIVIGGVLGLSALFAFLKWKHPDVVKFIVEPLTTEGPSLFQLFQAIAISGAAIATLWLTYKRTEALNSQAETAKEQAVTAQKQTEVAASQLAVNQQNLDRTESQRLQSLYHTALEKISGSDGTELSRVAAFKILQDVCEHEENIYSNDIAFFIESFINTATRDEYFEYMEKIEAHEMSSSHDEETDFPPPPPNRVDVEEAMMLFAYIQDQKTKLYGGCIFRRSIISDVYFRKKSLRSIVFEDSILINCTFEKANLRDSSFNGIIFIDCTFENCDLSNAFIHAEEQSHSNVFKKCKVDEARIYLSGDWKIFKNTHGANTPPLNFSPDEFLYQEDIEPLIENNARESNKKI